MKISINLVIWNGKKYLPYCLKSIANQTFRDFSLFILDNGSTDGTAGYLKSEILNPKSETNSKFQISNLRIEFNKENVGFAAGHNQAIRATDSDYVLMLNQDVILEPNFLEVAVKFLDAHPDVGAVTGKLLRWNFFNNEKTGKIDSAGIKIFKNHRAIELGAGEDGGKWNDPQEVFGVSGAAPVYRRIALENVAVFGECFDEDFFSYKEDVDLAYRLRLFGWKSLFLPEAKAYHDRTARTGEGEKNTEIISQRKKKSFFINYHSYKNHLFFLAKNVPAGIWLRYGCRIKWYEFKKFIYLLFFEPRTLRGIWQFFKKLPKMRKKRRWIQKNKKVSDTEIKKWLN